MQDDRAAQRPPLSSEDLPHTGVVKAARPESEHGFCGERHEPSVLEGTRRSVEAGRTARYNLCAGGEMVAEEVVVVVVLAVAAAEKRGVA